tara:strand:+ start:232 stop:759 length:528 start_codon:yes stop_codon:yes gene_type:complete
MAIIPDTTVRAVAAIAAETGIEQEVVRQCVDGFVAKITACLKAEVPFAVSGLCRFNHSYTLKRRPECDAAYYSDKVHREVKMKLFPNATSSLNGWVHDLGIKNNGKQELLRMKIKPDEIEKIRRRKTLQDQRELGFRSELLFEESPQGDTELEKTFAESPTVDQIAKRIGMNLDD